MNDTVYLLPGFLVSLAGNKKIKIPHLPANMRIANWPRMEVIDALSRGFTGNLDDLAKDVALRHSTPQQGIRRFIDDLKQAGCHASSAASISYPRELVTPKRSIVEGPVTLATPISFLVEAGNYLWFDHQGKLKLELSLTEFFATTTLARPIKLSDAWSQYASDSGTDGLDEAGFMALASRLAGAGLLVEARETSAPVAAPIVNAVEKRARVQAIVDEMVARHDEESAALGDNLVDVIPVNTNSDAAPAALGNLLAYAMDYRDKILTNRYNFVPMFLADEARLLERAATPGIYLFSNYLWTVEENLRLSKAIKATNPRNITVHGGPSTPKYDSDSEKFFSENPHVDITVSGEGELTLADLLDKIDTDNPLSPEVLKNVPGIAFRSSAGVIKTQGRERIADLNTIPSPYLTGLFDAFGSVQAGAILESNRGCPFGCTFCDWGSATLSKVRRFSLDRVYAELEWCAKNKIGTASFADANFGMLERDVDIAKKIAELKREYGYPLTVATNYAKNQVKHLRHIIEILADAGILSEGLVSLQSMDEQTLKVIDRSNIKLEKYNELATEFRRAKLPLAADIMMGLPGSTPKSFFDDLQKCTDLGVRVRANPTMVLTNSPMNEPGYREKHGISALPGEIMMESATYTRQEWTEMNNLRVAYSLFDNWGILRYVARYLRRDKGLREVAFYEKLRAEVGENASSWPVVATTLKTLEGYMAAPGSWGLFIDEVRRFIVDVVGVKEDSALRTVLQVQLAHLPAAERTFPFSISLEHDYAAWQDRLLTVREEGHRDDWELHTPHLLEFGPAELTVEDTNDICHLDVGKPLAALAYTLRSWEMNSPIARPRLGIGYG